MARTLGTDSLLVLLAAAFAASGCTDTLRSPTAVQTNPPPHPHGEETTNSGSASEERSGLRVRRSVVNEVRNGLSVVSLSMAKWPSFANLVFVFVFVFVFVGCVGPARDQHEISPSSEHSAVGPVIAANEA